MKITQFTFNHFGENTYVLFEEQSLDCAIIDPGCYFPDEEQKLLSFLQSNCLIPSKILYTHCHLDHAFGAKFLAEEFPLIQSYAHRNEQFFIDNALEQSRLFGVEMQQPPAISHCVAEGEIIRIGSTELSVIETPGHSAGGVCYYCRSLGTLFAGDTIFAESIGRSDLYGGNQDALIQSIQTKILTLPNETVILCGHGPQTQVGYKKRSNPYI